jgi:hypothetical protein
VNEKVTRAELETIYPRGREFVNASGRQAVVIGYRNNRLRGLQLIANYIHVFPDGYSAPYRQAIDLPELPEFSNRYKAVRP